MFSPEQRYFARIQFQNRILRAHAQRFEDLFVSVMTRRFVDFRPIKPQGRGIGDEANDGYVRTAGRYYQVYAPESPVEKVTDAVNKAKNNFDRLKDKWSETADVNEYRFAFNDKFLGAFPEIEHALADIHRTHGLTTAEPFLAKDLEAEFMQLEPDDMHEILGGVIPRAEFLQNIDYAVLTEVLQHLVDNRKGVGAGASLQVRDFNKKLTFNDVTEPVGILFTHGSYQEGEVENYFSRHGEFSRAEIREYLAALYQDCRSTAKQSGIADIAVGDRIFFDMLDHIVPAQTAQIQDAAIVLMAYFFEKCDIFEDPES